MDLAAGIAVIELIGAAHGFSVELTSADRALIAGSGTTREYAIKVRTKPPTPATVRHDVERLARGRDGIESVRLLYLVPHITRSLRDTAAADPRIAVTSVDEATLILDTHVWQQQEPAHPKTDPRGRKPWGRFAVMRALLRTDAPRAQGVLAEESGVSQQAVASALSKLAALGVDRVRGGWTTNAPAELWDAFLREYPGPGGLRRRWSGAAALDVQVARAIEAARGHGVDLLVSGDVAADQQAPHRRPLGTVVFASSDIDLSSRSALVSDASVDATMTVVVPADTTVFATARAWDGTESGLADPVITAWEVAHSRGADREDAVRALRERVLTDRMSG